MKIVICLKNPAPSLFSIHRPLPSFRNNNEQILRKLCCKRTNGRRKRTEFIGPSAITRELKNLYNEEEKYTMVISTE